MGILDQFIHWFTSSVYMLADPSLCGKIIGFPHYNW